jgi:hypothetical protein
VRSRATIAGVGGLAILVCLGRVAPPLLAASSSPDRALYGQAQAAETRLRHSRKLLQSRDEW